MDTRLMLQVKEILKKFPHYWKEEELQRPIVINDLIGSNVVKRLIWFNNNTHLDCLLSVL